MKAREFTYLSFAVTFRPMHPTEIDFDFIPEKKRGSKGYLINN